MIADHIRACAFLIADGVLPSNEGRGYVLRRIIRRAMRHGHKLGQREPFFHELVAALEQEMGEAYPELAAQRAHIERVLEQEEERFAETLAQGMALLDGAIGKLEGQQIPGEVVFRLYDTYGFPLDLTADIARERGLTVDEAGFEAAMDAQRERARAASRSASTCAPRADRGPHRVHRLRGRAATRRVVALLRGQQRVAELQAGEEGQVVLDRTPFYAESGGQVGDQGVLAAGAVRFVVTDTQKRGKVHLHVGRLEGGRRQAARRRHRAAEVDHARASDAPQPLRDAPAACRAAQGAGHARHAEGLAGRARPAALRLLAFSAVTPDELREIERLVNAQIRANAAAETRLMNFDAAVAAGAMALFGEKYDDEVRVLRIGDFSTELCGGTHVSRAGDIGLFKIVAEGGVAAGVRRIEAVTGEGALDHVLETEHRLRDVAGLVRGTRDDVEDKVRQLIERSRKLEKEIAQLKDKLASGRGKDLAADAETIAGVKVVATSVEGADAAALRNAVDQLKSQLGTAVIVLGSAGADGKVTLIAGVTADATDEGEGRRPGQLRGAAGRRSRWRPGGPRPGGRHRSRRLADALQSVAGWVRSGSAAESWSGWTIGARIASAAVPFIPSALTFSARSVSLPDAIVGRASAVSSRGCNRVSRGLDNKPETRCSWPARSGGSPGAGGSMIRPRRPGARMLILTRRVGETVMIGNDVTVTVLGVKGNQVRVGVNAPRDVAVHREEIFERIKREEQEGDSRPAQGGNGHGSFP